MENQVLNVEKQYKKNDSATMAWTANIAWSKENGETLTYCYKPFMWNWIWNAQKCLEIL